MAIPQETKEQYRTYKDRIFPTENLKKAYDVAIPISITLVAISHIGEFFTYFVIIFTASYFLLHNEDIYVEKENEGEEDSKSTKHTVKID